MSISTLELSESALERLREKLAESAKLARDQFERDTRRAFEDAFKGNMTMVEWVSYGGNRIANQSTREAFFESLDYTDPQIALWEVLKKSECPLVAKLRETVIENYISRWADDVAEFRA